MRGGQGKNIRLRGGAIIFSRDYLPNPTSPPYPIKNEQSLMSSQKHDSCLKKINVKTTGLLTN